ncbi:MAG: leucine--tRNA ligase [Acidobacteria bacterium]|nr:leucine--tRNA ligase [Acidobacteriota bacterium]
MARYEPSLIEPKWQDYWDQHQTFATPTALNGPKYYVLDMFPYPSGAGLHVGHPSGYTATDIMARYKRAKGFNVLHPMGWDAFGLPAEQYAIQTGTHPEVTTQKNIANFKRQLKSLGFSYDWTRELSTTHPDYYRWTQWIFLQLYQRGLAYVAEVPVNWCPALGTVLANEEVINGRSERGDHPVVRKPMRQWMLRITDYADRLLDDLESLDWPDSIKEMQRNWIGKSIGAEVDFKVSDHNANIRVFTTRPDTLFGATYMVLAPEHPLVQTLTTNAQRESVQQYIDQAATKSDLERTELAKEKTGVFTGAYAINPLNEARIPIWVADYVLISYGTGAIMAVPGHDQRDYEFARTFDLPIIEVITGGDISEAAHTGHGTLVNSGFINGLSVEEAKAVTIDYLVKHGLGQKAINYRLRDWLFSRQRYWGEPFPVAWDQSNQPHPLPEQQLPLRLPELADFQPSESGDPPLSKATEWLHFEMDGLPMRRETNTMPQWAGSCWYYLRFVDPHNQHQAWDKEKERYWMPVDLYVGGAEHAVLHLLYARFWHKVLYDAGYVSTAEPFMKLINQGLITSYSFKDASGRYVHTDDVDFDGNQAIDSRTGESLEFQVEKMSKGKMNVINPDRIIESYGADAFRLYEMFMGPLEMSKPWNTKSIDGVRRFLERVWRLVVDEETGALATGLSDTAPNDAIKRLYHKTIQGVSDDIEALRFNTAISKMMVLVNGLTKEDVRPREAVQGLLLMLAPFAPHLAEELWCRLGHQQSIAKSAFPVADPEWCVDDLITIVVQINGKKREALELPADIEQAEALSAAKNNERVASALQGQQIVREIFVPGRLINLVVKPRR